MRIITEDYYSDWEVAWILGISKRRLLVKVCENKDDLPPYIKIPGFRKRFWPKSEFEEWFNQFRIVSAKEDSNGN